MLIIRTTVRGLTTCRPRHRQTNTFFGADHSIAIHKSRCRRHIGAPPVNTVAACACLWALNVRRTKGTRFSPPSSWWLCRRLTRWLFLANRRCSQTNKHPQLPVRSLLQPFVLFVVPAALSYPTLSHLLRPKPMTTTCNFRPPLQLQHLELILALPCISAFMFQFVVSQSFFHRDFFFRDANPRPTASHYPL